MCEVLTYDPKVYQQVGTVEDAHEKYTMTDVLDCGEEIVANGVENIIGLCPLHRHFDMDEESMMVESIDIENSETVTKPMPLSANLDVVPCMWKIEENGIIPIQFQFNTNKNQPFVNNLSSIVDLI
ncbi:unnamed protein product [Rotaria sordida]|uniref:Uncharacterized protein n=1 Tax=Rotaria sordida TaxID=392033 RepID=A0A815DGS5_9BILA|nr:unnamed protein product [Rotaria sordida]CAF1571872.1 unnamed protein product [Rotaria sordida]